jgi:hypothetical protein
MSCVLQCFESVFIRRVGLSVGRLDFVTFARTHGAVNPQDSGCLACRMDGQLLSCANSFCNVKMHMVCAPSGQPCLELGRCKVMLMSDWVGEGDERARTSILSFSFDRRMSRAVDERLAVPSLPAAAPAGTQFSRAAAAAASRIQAAHRPLSRRGRGAFCLREYVRL